MRTLILILGFILLLLIPESAAQPLPPWGEDGPDQVPIDGGLAILAAAGGAYAINKLRGKKS